MFNSPKPHVISFSSWQITKKKTEYQIFMEIVMWVYHDKANGSLLFLLEFNLKVFRENNTTIRVLLTFWTFSGDRQFTVETTIFSNSGQGGRCRNNWKCQIISRSSNCQGHCIASSEEPPDDVGLTLQFLWLEIFRGPRYFEQIVARSHNNLSPGFFPLKERCSWKLFDTWEIQSTWSKSWSSSF